MELGSYNNINGDILYLNNPLILMGHSGFSGELVELMRRI
jgi:hypothetical protein